MGFENIFRNKLARPATRPLITGAGGGSWGGGERTIIWSSDSSGLLARLEALEDELSQLRSELIARQDYTSSDLDPDPNVDAVTGYELASDGTLRAYVEVSVEGRSLYEVALLGDPAVVYAAKDAKVAEAAPDTNYGTGNDLVAAEGDPSAAQRSWVQFDWGTYPDDLYGVAPALAMLRLHKTGANDDEIGLVLNFEDFAGDDWVESSITWNNQPDIEAACARIKNVAGTEYNYFDVTSLFYTYREVKSGEWDEEPYGLAVFGEREGSISATGLVDWDSLDGAGDDDEKPQLWYWEQAEKSQLMGGTVRTARFYGNPGGSYYLVHRMLDENNNPGRWSDPVEISLPSTGATPAAPSLAVSRLNPNSLTQLVITYTEPADFSRYEIEERLQSDSSLLSTIKTSTARFIYQSYQHSHDDTKFRVRAVTRSGLASSWSSYVDNDAPDPMMISGGAASVRFGSPSTDDVTLYTGSTGKAYKAKGLASPKELLTPDEFGSKALDFNMIEGSCDQATDNTSQNFTGTTLAARDEITITPPGSGNAYYLLIARCTVSKGTSTGIRLTFTVDTVATDSEEAWSATDVYETVTFMRRVGVTAGSSHSFKIAAKAADANTAIISRSNFVAIHLGNY